MYLPEPPAAYVQCAPKPIRKVVYGIAMTETAGTGDPLQLVDTSTLKVYRPQNPGEALAIIHRLEKRGHNVAIGAFGLKSSNFPGWKITNMDALNACWAASFASRLLMKNESWAWGEGHHVHPRKWALAAYTVGRLTMKSGGLQYADAVRFYAEKF